MFGSLMIVALGLSALALIEQFLIDAEPELAPVKPDRPTLRSIK